MTVPPMPHHDAPVNHRTRCRTMSDRSSAGFLKFLPCRVFRCSLAPRSSYPGSCRRANPGQSRRRGRVIYQAVLSVAAVRSTGDRRRTLLLSLHSSLSSIPRNRICVTPKAVLGFHAPRWVDGQGRQYAATAETRIFVATYPAPVRAWIERHGGLTSKLILLRGRELTSMFPRCS